MNMKQQTKVTAAGLITAQLAAVTAWVAGEFWRLDIPQEIAIAGASLVVALVQYVVPDRQ